ncbi:DUF3883 domain-containing protein [Algoriphagus sp.]|uniref:protein NO VEIN domain-containing protein n=1 Tax=Algoriphagus sp. TaxID=1872435 RepID=UPI0032938F08
MNADFTERDKAILIGLYFSKFDKEGLQFLGFDRFQEAYNILGFSLGIKPNSLKNYRDEFDPAFPNNRLGRRNRPMRAYCKKILEKYSHLDLITFSRLIKNFFSRDFEIEEIIEKSERTGYSESIAKRLATGKAAEEYFKKNFESINDFRSFKIKDTTNYGCGFDFKLSNETKFYCVEVKGLSEASGNILLTEKEFYMAQTYTHNFCLFVVKNFIDKPFHDYFFDPLNSRLAFSKVERPTIIVSYTSYL